MLRVSKMLSFYTALSITLYYEQQELASDRFFTKSDHYLI